MKKNKMTLLVLLACMVISTTLIAQQTQEIQNGGFSSWGKPTPKEWPNEPKDYRDVPFLSSEADLKEILGSNITSCSTAGQFRLCNSARLIGGVHLQEQYCFYHDHLAGVSVTFDRTKFNEVEKMFIDKYGDPTNIINGNQSAWEGNAIRLLLNRYPENSDASIAQFIHKEEAARILEDSKKL